MKTKNSNKLVFSKHVITELNDMQLNDINGGSSPTCSYVLVFLASVALSYDITSNDSEEAESPEMGQCHA